MIRQPGLALLKQMSRTLQGEDCPSPWPFLSLSYQDVVATDAELVAELGDAALALPIRPDSKLITDWHKCEAITTKIPDWHELLRMLRFDPLSVDIVNARGCEQLMDLNMPVVPRHYEQYACVLDNVAHHCFDVVQALKNIVAMPRIGGFVLHVTPLGMINHGFYSISPTLLHDVYTNNGYEVISHTGYVVNRTGEPCAPVEIDPTRRMKKVPDDAMQLFLARRRGVRRPFCYPVQSKFARHPNSTIVSGETR